MCSNIRSLAFGGLFHISSNNSTLAKVTPPRIQSVGVRPMRHDDDLRLIEVTNYAHKTKNVRIKLAIASADAGIGQSKTISINVISGSSAPSRKSVSYI